MFDCKQDGNRIYLLCLLSVTIIEQLTSQLNSCSLVFYRLEFIRQWEDHRIWDDNCSIIVTDRRLFLARIYGLITSP